MNATIKCLVVDDEPLARKVLTEYIAEFSGLELIGEFGKPIEALEFLSTHQVDVLYLDINMPGLSGIDLFKSLKNKPITVFTTAYSEFAVEAFEINAFDYLVKPISLERFVKSYKKIKDRYSSPVNDEEEQENIIVKEGKRHYNVDLSTIYYIQAYGDYVRIFTTEKTFITKERLSLYVDSLPSYFEQIHRSYIVNVNHVEYVEGNHIQISDTKIPISKAYRSSFLSRMQ